MSIIQRCMILALITSLVYLFVFQIQAIWPFTIDDMYIPLRYARHWTEGLGLVWNAAELPVEGYSNFSFVLLGRLALELGLNPVIVLKGAGVVGLFLTCIAIYTLSRFWFLARFAVIPCIWLLAYRGQILWSVSGLETTIYQALIAFSVVLVFKGMGYRAYPEPQQGTRISGFVYAGILLALAGMTRPEAPVFVVLFVGLVWFCCWAKAQPAVILTTFLLCFSGYFLWRWNFYGRLFPNPVYCKGMSGSMNFILDKKYIILVWPFVLLAIPAIWSSTDRRHYFLWLPSVLYVVLLVSASPVVAFDNRLFLPAFVLILPLALQGIQLMVKQAIAVYVVSTLVLFFCIPMLSLAGLQEFTRNPLAGERLRQNVLEWLENNTHPSSRVVLADSGLIPYRSSLRFTDSYCLNNAEMTRKPTPNMYERFCTQTMREKPDVIILTALVEHGQVIYTPADACMSGKLKSSEQYKLQASLGTGDKHGFYRYEIYQIKRDV